MSTENVKKLELGIDKIYNCEKYLSAESITREMMQPLIDEGIDLVEKTISSGEMDVLNRAFDFFNEEYENGICETLMSFIWQYYSINQIMDVLNHKFNQLINNNLMRSVQFFGYCLNAGRFDDMRRLFNTVQAERSTEFLEEFIDWYEEDYPQEIEILKQDMEKWNSKQ